jgi:hypothetical protein
MNQLDRQQIALARLHADYEHYKADPRVQAEQADYDRTREALIAEGLDILDGPRDIAWERAQQRAERRAMPDFSTMKRQFVDNRARAKFAKALGLPSED